jgi:hypothetical protein
MTRAVLTACFPWIAALAVLMLAAYSLIRLCRCQVSFRRVLNVHRDQRGSVQSLSFVLTLPIFVMIVLLIVQVSQLMIAEIVVQYAAFAAARSAIVWIPAKMPGVENADCISQYVLDPNAPSQDFPVINPASPEFAPSTGGVTYLINPGSWKYNKIASAAIMACAPIAPSRDLGIPLSGQTAMKAEIINQLYASMVPASATNARIPRRLENKLAYSENHTKVEVRFYHKNSEPPLGRPPSPYFLQPDPEEFYENEIGWQDPVTVTVTHEFALLPGPGRLLAPFIYGPGGMKRIEKRSFPQGAVYVCTLSASATLGNEGEKSTVPYEYGY